MQFPQLQSSGEFALLVHALPVERGQLFDVVLLVFLSPLIIFADNSATNLSTSCVSSALPIFKGSFDRGGIQFESDFHVLAFSDISCNLLSTAVIK